jgi:hypothetical protein
MTNSTSSPISASGNWFKQKNIFLAKFSALTDADFDFEAGKKEEMLNNIRIKIGKTKDQLERIILAFS